MKKEQHFISSYFYVHVVCILFFSIGIKNVSAQLTYIPDPAFAAFLQTNFSAAMIYPDSLDQNNSLVTGAVLLDCSGQGIADLAGCSAFINLQQLKCYSNYLSTLPVLPNALTILNCSNNNLTALPVLPNSLLELYCYNNIGLSSLVLPGSLQILEISGCFFSALPLLPSSLSELYCSSNNLTLISPLPSSLLALDCSQNQISSLPSLPSTLKNLYCGNNSLTSLPTLPSGLLGLYCGGNSALALPISWPPSLYEVEISQTPSVPFPSFPSSLQNLNCESMIPPLLNMPTLPQNLSSLNIGYNALSTIPTLPLNLFHLNANNNNINQISQPLPSTLKSFKLLNNPITCIPELPAGFDDGLVLDANDCLFNKPVGCTDCQSYNTCTPAYNCNNLSYVSGTVFNDMNSNGSLNGSEPGLPKIYLFSNNGNFSTSCDSNGNYYLPSDTGINFIVNAQIPPYRILSSTPANHFFANYGYIDSLNNIGIYDLPGVNDLAVSLTSFGGQVPGFNYHSHLTLNNPGTIIQTGQLYFIKPSLTNFISATPVQASVSGDTIFWNFTALQPLVPTLNYDIELFVPTGTALGTIITSYVGILSSLSDSTPGNNFAVESSTITGSFDPNDKTAEPENAFTTTQLANGEFMNFTVRFQNTGTGPAINIVIVDSLSSDFDLTTFQIVSASHNYIWKIENRILYARFENINLPDSGSNESLSHGFIRYKVKPNAIIQVGEIMYNTAYIYFDFNSPVQTNTTNTVIVIPSGIAGNNNVNYGFRLYPNPVNTALVMHFNTIDFNPVPKFEIFDLTGKSILNGKIISTDQLVDVSLLNEGMYMMRVKFNGYLIQRRFVKQ